MRTFLVLATLLLSSCYTPPKVVEVPDEGYNVKCTGLEPSCRSMNAQILIEKDTNTKLSKSEIKHKRFSVFGRCELVVETAQHTTSSYPCTELRLSLLKPSGEERNTWIQGNEFEIHDLTRGPFVVKVYSDQYMTGADKAKIQPGQPMHIEIHLTPPAVKSATAM